MFTSYIRFLLLAGLRIFKVTLLAALMRYYRTTTADKSIRNGGRRSSERQSSLVVFTLDGNCLLVQVGNHLLPDYMFQ